MNFAKNRWQQLAGLIKEGSMGTDDSIDGPYKTTAENQPFNDNKHRKDFLRQIHVESTLGENRFPPTATEYAEELNSKSSGPFKLVTDAEHWNKVGVHTGEQLARYLAIEAYHDAYKDAYGIRPRHVNLDDLSLDEIEQKTRELFDDISEEEY